MCLCVRTNEIQIIKEFPLFSFVRNFSNYKGIPLIFICAEFPHKWNSIYKGIPLIFICAENFRTNEFVRNFRTNEIQFIKEFLLFSFVRKISAQMKMNVILFCAQMKMNFFLPPLFFEHFLWIFLPPLFVYTSFFTPTFFQLFFYSHFLIFATFFLLLNLKNIKNNFGISVLMSEQVKIATNEALRGGGGGRAVWEHRAALF